MECLRKKTAAPPRQHWLWSENKACCCVAFHTKCACAINLKRDLRMFGGGVGDEGGGVVVMCRVPEVPNLLPLCWSDLPLRFHWFLCLSRPGAELYKWPSNHGLTPCTLCQPAENYGTWNAIHKAAFILRMMNASGFFSCCPADLSEMDFIVLSALWESNNE